MNAIDKIIQQTTEILVKELLKDRPEHVKEDQNVDDTEGETVGGLTDVNVENLRSNAKSG
jgi:hypothetical protein